MTLPVAFLHVAYGAVLNALLLRATTRLMSRVPGRIGRGHVLEEKTTRFLDRAAAAVVIAATLVVSLVTLGGVLGILSSRGAILALTVALWLGVELVTLGRTKAPESRSTPMSGDAGLCGGSRMVGLAAVLVAAAWLPLFIERIALPPVAWDALTYHLRFPVLWLQTGHLMTAAAPMGDPSHTFYPLVGEMLLYWGILSTGTDHSSSVSQVPFALVSAGVIASLGIRHGARVGVAVLAALCWLGTPSVLRQSVEAMVDIELACYFLCALLFAGRWRDGGGRAWFYLSAASVGLLVGTKYTGIVYVAAITPLLALLVHDASRRGQGPRLGVGTIVSGVALIVMIGGYAYVRNFTSSGNPLLPIQLEIGGATILRGSLQASHYLGGEAPRLGWLEFLASPRSVLEMGPVFVPLLSILPLGLIVALRRRDESGLSPAWIASVAILGLVLAATILPFREHRYFYAVTALAWCQAAILAGRLSPAINARWVAVTLLLVQAPITLFYWAKDLILVGSNESHAVSAIAVAALGASFGLRLPLCGWAMTVAWRAAGSRSRAAAAAVVVALLAGMAAMESAYVRDKFDLWYRHWSTRHEWERPGQARADFRDMAASWRYLAELTRSERAVIAYSGMNTPHALAGARFQHRVLYVPRNQNEHAWHYDWGTSPPDPLTGGTREAWDRNVVRLGVRYLCVYRLAPRIGKEGRFPVERAWADSDPERFKLLWMTPNVRVYGVEGSTG